jgi:polysaccharide biosynthesis transport protein
MANGNPLKKMTKNSTELMARALAVSPLRDSAGGQALTTAPVPASGYVSFGGLRGLLWRRKWTILAALMAGLAAGLTMALVQTPVYRAATTLEIQLPNDDYLNRRQLEPSLLPGVLNIDPFLQTEMKRLGSDGLLWSVFEDLDLAQHAEFLPKPGTPQPTRGQLLEVLRTRTATRLAGQAQVVEITFEANDPKLAAAFVNKLVDNYRTQALDRRKLTAGQAADLMSGQLKTLRQSLETSQSRLQQFVRREGVMSGLDREGLAEARLRQIQIAHVTAQETRIAEESRYGEAAAAREKGELDNDTLAKYRIQLTELERRRAEAAEVYQPAHFKVRQIEAEIATVNQAAEAERANLLRRMRSQVNAASVREKNLKNNLDQQANLAAQQVTSEVEFTSLKHDVDGYQQLYDALQQKVREASLAAAVPSSTVVIMDRADVPFRPIRPKRLFLVAIGSACGLLLGMLVVLGSAAASPATQTQTGSAPPAAEPTLALVPRLASIPRFDLGGRAEMGVACQPDSYFAENFRRLASRILAAHAHAWPRIIVVSGFEPHRGRTTVATNLALTLANQGRHVLLVDADDMGAHVRAQMGIRGGRVIAASNEPTQPLCSVWITSQAGLSVARLSSEAVLRHDGQLLEDLESEFDAVIVDAPPLGSWPEPSWTHRFADGLLLVTGTEVVSQARVRRLLQESVVPVLGVVVNSSARYSDLPGPAAPKELA